MLISDWSSDVCSSDLKPFEPNNLRAALTILSRGDSPSTYFLETRFIRSPSLGSRHLPTLCRRPRPPRSAMQISHAYMPDEQGKSNNGSTQERTEGKEWVRPFRTSWQPHHYNKK